MTKRNDDDRRKNRFELALASVETQLALAGQAEVPRVRELAETARAFLEGLDT